MLLNFLTHLLSFDVAWIVSFVLSNLHYLFAMVALMYYIVGEKRFLTAFIFFTIGAWIIVDFETITGWVYYVAGFLALLYVSRMAVSIYAEASPKWSERLLLVLVIQFVLLFIFFNLFLR